MKVIIVEKAKKTVGDEISSQMDKGKKQDQAIAIALSKKERGEIKENVDMGVIQRMGLSVGKQLGKGKSGSVYEANKNGKDVALKVVNKGSFAYDREKQNYSNIKKFISKARKGGVEKWLPVVYDVQEHDDGVYIVLERLLPLTSAERRNWKGALQATVEQYKLEKEKDVGYAAIEYIEDTGAPEIDFNYQKATKIISLLSKQPEFSLLKKKPDHFASIISQAKTKDDSAFKIFTAAKMMDDTMLEILLTLYSENLKFQMFFNNLATVMDKTYTMTSKDDISDNEFFVSAMLEGLYDTIFAQKNPMKFIDRGKADSESTFQSGYGQTSSIYDHGVTPNPIKPFKKKKKGWVSRILSALFGKSKKKRKKPQKKQRPYSGPNPIPKGKGSLFGPEPKKYEFDPEIDAINRLGQLFNIKSKDLHNANIMKRSDGQLVFVDVGLFDTTAMVSESRNRKIIVKLT